MVSSGFALIAHSHKGIFIQRWRHFFQSAQRRASLWILIIMSGRSAGGDTGVRNFLNTKDKKMERKIQNNWNPAGMIENQVSDKISGKGQDIGD